MPFRRRWISTSGSMAHSPWQPGAGDRRAAAGALVLPRTDDRQDIRVGQTFLERLQHLAAARRHAAGAQADAHVDFGDRAAVGSAAPA